MHTSLAEAFKECREGELSMQELPAPTACNGQCLAVFRGNFSHSLFCHKVLGSALKLPTAAGRAHLAKHNISQTLQPVCRQKARQRTKFTSNPRRYLPAFLIAMQRSMPCTSD